MDNSKSLDVLPNVIVPVNLSYLTLTFTIILLGTLSFILILIILLSHLNSHVHVFQSVPDFILAAIASVVGSDNCTQPETDPIPTSIDPTTISLVSDKVEDADSGKVLHSSTLLFAFTVLSLSLNYLSPPLPFWGGGQPDFSDFSDPDFGKINFHIGKIGKQFFANISHPDHFRAYVDSLGWWQPPQKRHTTKNF